MTSQESLSPLSNDENQEYDVEFEKTKSLKRKLDDDEIQITFPIQRLPLKESHTNRLDNPSECETTQNGSKVSVKRFKEKDLNLNLKDNLKKRLVDLMAKFNLVLNDGLSVSSSFRNDLIKECNYALIELTSLPLVSSETITSNVPLNYNSNSKLVYVINWKFRSTILNHLVRNKNLAVLNKNVGTKTKNSMFKLNNNFVGQLLNLRVSHVEDDDDMDSESSSIDKNMINLNNEMLKLRKSVNEVKEEMFLLKDDILSNCEDYFHWHISEEQYGEIDSRLEFLEDKVENGDYDCGCSGDFECDLESQLEEQKKELMEKINAVDITRSNATFDFKVNGITEFLQDCGKKSSDFFYCQGIPWQVQVVVAREPNEEYAKKLDRFLQVYLKCNNRDYTDWSCNLKCEFILISHNDPGRNKARKGAHKFNKIENCGFSKFMNLNHIYDESNGYVDSKDDSITLRVFLEAEKVVRTSDL